MGGSSFFDLLPGFTSGVKAIHNDLVGVCFLLAVTGFLIHAVHALVRKDGSGIFLTLVRLLVVAILVGSLGSWGDLLNSAVTGLIADLGATGSPATVFEDYQAAIARKLGTATAAQNFNQSSAPSAATEGDTSGGFSPQIGGGPANGLKLTSYGYSGDLTPDKYSNQGSGAFPFSSAPGSLISGYSAALSPDVAKQYNISPGQSFSVSTTSGQSYNLVYADVTGNDPATGLPLTGRVDIYDQSGQLGGNNFEQSISSLNGGPIVQGQTGLASMMPNPGGSLGDQVLWAITLGLSWIASAIMWLMQILQGILYLIEVAISPIFIGFLMIPALTHLARRFFLAFAALCLWPFGWSVANLVTLALVNLAVNPSNNGVLGAINTAALFTGPLAGLAILLVLAVWVIGSTLGAPFLIGFLLSAGGGTAVSALFGATLGAAAGAGARTALHAVGGPIGVASLVGSIGSNGSNGSAPISAQSASRMNTTQNFARRPMREEGA